MKKALSNIFLICGAVAAIFFCWDVWVSAAPGRLLQTLWNRDFTMLEAEHKLPKEWLQIREVELKYLSDEAKALSSDLVVPVNKDPKGLYRLEVEVDDWVDGKEFGAVFHYHLVQIEKDTTIWELGRTFRLGVN